MSQVGVEDTVFFHNFSLLTGLLNGSSGQVNVMNTFRSSNGKILELVKKIVERISSLLVSLFKAKMYILMLQAAVISLGLIGAGTKNARIAGMLRNLSSFRYKDDNLLFCVMLLMNLVFSSILYLMELRMTESLCYFFSSNCSRSYIFGEGLINS